MRLLNVRTLQLEYFHKAQDVGSYAILSHTWEEEEVLFEDMYESPQDKEIARLSSKINNLESYIKTLNQVPIPGAGDHQPCEAEGPLRWARKKKGWQKIEGCCQEAAKFGIEYVWIDTCCICKGDSSELSEAINSMFAWYAQADVCFAFLGDTNELRPMSKSRWFTRGWTLQELLAPKQVLFYQADWLSLGSRSSLAHIVASITKIPESVLLGGLSKSNNSQFGVAIKMGWAAGRQTTRPEDQAYSLMGLFQVNMPTLYGEGEQSALFRLQSEIFKGTGDHSTLAWCYNGFEILSSPWQIVEKESYARTSSCSLLAPRTRFFLPLLEDFYLPGGHSSDGPVPIPRPVYPHIYSEAYSSDLIKNDNRGYKPWKYSAHTHGIRVHLLLERLFEDSDLGFLAHLACSMDTPTHGNFNPELTYSAGILLRSSHLGTFERVFPRVLIAISSQYKPSTDLWFQDVYLTERKVDYNIEPRRIRRRMTGQYIVQVSSADFAKAKVMLKAHNADSTSTGPIGPLLQFKQAGLAPNVLLFEDIETGDEQKHPNFAIRWRRESASRERLEVIMDLPQSTSLFSLLERDFTGPKSPISKELQRISSDVSKNGICVVVAFQVVGDIFLMEVSISRTGFEVPMLDSEAKNKLERRRPC